MKRLLFLVGDGIGNQTQTVPAFIHCKRRYNCPIDVYNSIPRNTESTQTIFKSLADNIYVSKEKLKPNRYGGQVLSYPFFQKKYPGITVVSSNVSSLMKTKRNSEVDMNLRAVGTKTSKYFDWSDCYKVFDWIDPQESPDVILHNGFSKVSIQARKTWLVKSYPHYGKLANLLKEHGITVGSIGSEEEYIEGTMNLTGKSFQDSLAHIKGCKLFISNDTGTYHLANLLAKKNIVLFTASDNIKNYDRHFHRFSTIIQRDDLPCQPCHLKREFNYWNKKGVKEKCGWECGNIDPEKVLEKAKELI